jgi:predicted nucleic acid-binding protein
MAYNIRHIDNVGLQKKMYFFDANLWLKILKPPFSISKKDQKYLDFFEKFKNHPQHPKIVVTALVLSEVINRYLREVSFRKFCKKNGVGDPPPPSYYKEIYRSSQQFQADYVSIGEDIKTYQNFYELIPDGLTTDIKQKDILTSPPVNLDFNDLYYYKLSLKNGFTIVTDDKDFFVEDVEVITYNNQLIEKAKAAVEVKK